MTTRDCHPPRLGPARQRAFTLLEALFAVTFLALAVGGAYRIVAGMQADATEEINWLSVSQIGWTTAEEVNHLLMDADPSSIDPPVLSGATKLEFRRVTGYDRGNVTLSPLLKLRFAAPKGGSAFGRIEYRSETGKWETIAGNVAGLSFDSQPGGVSFTVTVGARDHSGTPVTREFRRRVTFRNRP